MNYFRAYNTTWYWVIAGLVLGFAIGCQFRLDSYQSVEHNLMFSYPDKWEVQEQANALWLVNQADRGVFPSEIWIQRVPTTPEMEVDLLEGLQTLSVCTLAAFNLDPDQDCTFTLEQLLENTQGEKYDYVEDNVGKVAVVDFTVEWEFGVSRFQSRLFRVGEEVILIDAVWIEYEDRSDKVAALFDTILATIRALE